MSFGEALDLCKKGCGIKRLGWNGKNQYVELATCISYKNKHGEMVNVEHDAIGNEALAFVGTSGVQIGWLASQADMLADDWVIADCLPSRLNLFRGLTKMMFPTQMTGRKEKL